MDFINAKELLELCDKKKMSISDVMKIRECDESTSSKEEIINKMKRVLEIMRDSSTLPVNTPIKSMGGLIGGEAKKLSEYQNQKKNIGSNVCNGRFGVQCLHGAYSCGAYRRFIRSSSGTLISNAGCIFFF